MANQNSANNGAYIYTVAEVAAMLELKAQPNGKYHGAPNGTGKTEDGFVLCPEGNAFTNDGTKYTSIEVAQLAEIEPAQYAPVAEYRARNGNGSQSRPTNANGAGNARKARANVPFDWPRAQTFDYTDETGDLLYQVGRIGDGAAKQIRQRKPDGRGGWLWQLGDVRRVLYRLSDVMTAQTVVICEGEKAAIALNEAFERDGLLGECVATTNAQGAGKWQDEFCEQLNGAAVCVLPDNDEIGDKHGAAVCASIEASGRAATVKRVDIPNLPEKGDAFDYLEAGGTVAALLDWFEAAPNWKPPAPARRFKFSSLAEVMTRPDPEFLIYRVLTLGGTSLLTAKHASFKSFIALDMGLSVAVGRAWHGFNTRRGAVVYIAAEGAAGIKKRARVWLDFYDEETPENFVVLDVPFQVSDDNARADFIAEVADLCPALIILDTLARCAVGLEENSSKDMGGFADALGDLARETGAHVMTVHHNNKGGDYRGSSAVPAAVDTHLSLDRTGDRVKLEMLKQKDADELLPIVFEKIEVSIPGTRGQTHSLVFEKLDNSEGGANSLSTVEENLMSELTGAFGDEGATAAQWGKVCEAVGITDRTFRRAKEKLIDMGAVKCPDKGARGAKFTVSPDWGQGDKSGTLPLVPDDKEESGTHGHTPLGVAVMSPCPNERENVVNQDPKGQDEIRGNCPDLDAKGQKAKDPFAPDPEKVARLAQLRAEAPPTKCTSCGDTDLAGAFYSLDGDAVRTECAQCFALLSDAPPPEKPKKKSKRAKANEGAEPYNVPTTGDGDDLELVTA
jgi:hypothetical protein